MYRFMLKIIMMGDNLEIALEIFCIKKVVNSSDQIFKSITALKFRILDFLKAFTTY